VIAFHIREYGSSDWTEAIFEGDLEESVAEALAGALAEEKRLHVQKREDGEWEDL